MRNNNTTSSRGGQSFGGSGSMSAQQGYSSYRGRGGGYNNRGGMNSMSNYNRGGYQQPMNGGYQSSTMGGFQGMNTMQPYGGFQNRGGMMNNMRGNAMGMRGGGRGGMGANGMMGMPMGGMMGGMGGMGMGMPQMGTGMAMQGMKSSSKQLALVRILLFLPIFDQHCIALSVEGPICAEDVNIASPAVS